MPRALGHADGGGGHPGGSAGGGGARGGRVVGSPCSVLLLKLRSFPCSPPSIRARRRAGRRLPRVLLRSFPPPDSLFSAPPRVWGAWGAAQGGGNWGKVGGEGRALDRVAAPVVPSAVTKEFSRLFRAEFLRPSRRVVKHWHHGTRSRRGGAFWLPKVPPSSAEWGGKEGKEGQGRDGAMKSPFTVSERRAAPPSHRLCSAPLDGCRRALGGTTPAKTTRRPQKDGRPAGVRRPSARRRAAPAAARIPGHR